VPFESFSLLGHSPQAENRWRTPQIYSLQFNSATAHQGHLGLPLQWHRPYKWYHLQVVNLSGIGEVTSLHEDVWGVEVKSFIKKRLVNYWRYKRNVILYQDSYLPFCAGSDIVDLLFYAVNFLTPWSRVLLQKLIVTHLVKKFPAFYGVQMSIIVF
jgi:hypothetical protein